MEQDTHRHGDLVIVTERRSDGTLIIRIDPGIEARQHTPIRQGGFGPMSAFEAHLASAFRAIPVDLAVGLLILLWVGSGIGHGCAADLLVSAAPGSFGS
jgi:hypothetical protein